MFIAPSAAMRADRSEIRLGAVSQHRLPYLVASPNESVIGIAAAPRGIARRSGLLAERPHLREIIAVGAGSRGMWVLIA
ncbi:hypothetical protein CQ12_21105 [Bradyrhizobium jicamae]|uniref:Uncharacterized protein n=1 Tax=Bradyrhizobium jicamae TaxID=280332 RepID=A0A0R3LA47_9BRAD|nr:hypothetical protein CQ12_21105 [Bradyrhizobium jicamae]